MQHCQKKKSDRQNRGQRSNGLVRPSWSTDLAWVIRGSRSPIRPGLIHFHRYAYSKSKTPQTASDNTTTAATVRKHWLKKKSITNQQLHIFNRLHNLPSTPVPTTTTNPVLSTHHVKTDYPHCPRLLRPAAHIQIHHRAPAQCGIFSRSAPITIDDEAHAPAAGDAGG
jgi:hypothetical protein